MSTNSDTVSVRKELPSDISLREFAEAMRDLDLTSVPPEKRQAAIMDHVVHIMVGTLQDRAKADELAHAWLQRLASLNLR